MITPEDIGKTVQYFDRDGLQRIGTLMRIEKNYAIIKHSVLKKKQKAPLGECVVIQIKENGKSI
jgi:hypothetical protein